MAGVMVAYAEWGDADKGTVGATGDSASGGTGTGGLSSGPDDEGTMSDRRLSAEKSGTDDVDDQESRQSGESRLGGGNGSGDSVLELLFGEASKPFSWKSSSPPATR